MGLHFFLLMQLAFDSFVETSWSMSPIMDPVCTSVMALDLETCDPTLNTEGVGYLRNKGHIAGVSLAWLQEDRIKSVYYPFGHHLSPNHEKNKVRDFLVDQLSKVDVLVTANAQYDVGWLMADLGIIKFPKVVDVIQMAVLLEEEYPGSYSLNALSLRYLNKTKDEKILREAAELYGQDPKKHMWKLPAYFVGPYACVDAERTLELYHCLAPKIERDNLGHVLDIESRLIHALLKMSFRGVPVDRTAAHSLSEEWFQKEQDLIKSIGGLDVWSGVDVAKKLIQAGCTLPRTKPSNTHPNGIFSVAKDVLENLDHPLAGKIHYIRTLNRLRSTYVDALILNNSRDTIHPEYISTVRDEGGARTGRLACRNPNLQQIPTRNKELGADRIRALFKAPEGLLWAKCDYNSQEPRLQVHYALLDSYPGANEALEALQRGEKIYTLIEKNAGISYDDAKQASLARSYNMKAPSFARRQGLSLEDAERVLDAFDGQCPYVSMLSGDLEKAARLRGWIRTLSGRRRHFNWWKPHDDWNETAVYGKSTAMERWPDTPLARAYTSKAFNSLIQGSAADMIKLAILDLNDANFFTILSVHDENNALVSSEAEARRMKLIMEQVMDLKVPIVADLHLADGWR